MNFLTREVKFDFHMPDSRVTPELPLYDRLSPHSLQGVSCKSISSDVDTTSGHSLVIENQVVATMNTEGRNSGALESKLKGLWIPCVS